jgi:hypothetical protein
MSITGMTVDDRLAIHDLLARYAWTLNTGDIDGFVDAFTPDGVIDERGRHGEGREQIAGFARYHFARPAFPGRQHWVHHVLMRGNARRCTVKSFCVCYEWIRGTDIRQIYRTFSYNDVCVKRDGRWFFKERNIRRWFGEDLPWVGPAQAP